MANLKMAYSLQFSSKIAWTDRNMIAYYLYEANLDKYPKNDNSHKRASISVL